MEQLLPAYNDPLFSILLIIIISLIIAIATYGWSVYKQQKEQGSLLKFLDKFDSAECALDTADMPFEPHMFKPLALLTKAFEAGRSGMKMSPIYLYLNKNISNDLGRFELMERLGNTYLHAGFLERAKSIYVEVLRKKPRNTSVLYELGVVYEMMHQYEKAKEVIEPLELLGEDTYNLKKFLELLQITSNKSLSTADKLEKLKQLLNEEPTLYRQIISVLLRLDTYVAWQMIDTERTKEILDILWFLPNSQLDLDIIAAKAPTCSY